MSNSFALLFFWNRKRKTDRLVQGFSNFFIHGTLCLIIFAHGTLRQKKSNYKFAKNINRLFLQVKKLNLLKRVIKKRNIRM